MCDHAGQTCAQKLELVRLPPLLLSSPVAANLTPHSTGNKAWEDQLVRDYGPNSTVIRCSPNDVEQNLLQLEERHIANRLSKKKHVLEYNIILSGRVMTRQLQGKSLEDRWKAMTVLEREEIVLWSLIKVTEAVRETSEARAEVPEITLEAMCGGDGSGWCRLVQHFLVDLVDDPTDFAVLHHEVWDRQMLLDKAGENLPLHRAIRAYQEEAILGRHIFILLFLIACTSRMEGMDFGHTHVRSTEGTSVSDLTKLSLGDDAKKIAEYKFVEKDTVKLADVTSVPTFVSAPSKPTIPLTTGIHRHLGEMKFDKNASWHAFYGTNSQPQKRIFCIPDIKTRKAFEKVRDKAIHERDLESVAVILELLYDLADGSKVTREGIERQMVGDFGIPLGELKKVGMNKEKLDTMGLRFRDQGGAASRHIPYGAPGWLPQR
ncbi:hypothetical protein P7C70_g2497, partial [Phenoliferia sp. Uapishka_3]